MRNLIWAILFIAAIPFMLFVVAFDWALFGSEKDRIKDDYN